MNLKKESDISSWAESIEDFSPEYTPVRTWSVAQFFWLKGRTYTITSANLEPIPDLHYALYDPGVKRYYFREHRGYSLDELYFYRRTLDFSGEDIAIRQLRERVIDNNITILMTSEQLEQTNQMLDRLWRSRYNTEGKLFYKYYVEIVKLSLDLEDYRLYGKSLQGFLTACNIYENSIAKLWQQAYERGVKN